MNNEKVNTGSDGNIIKRLRDCGSTPPNGRGYVDASQYASGANECTQRAEAAGECVMHKKHHHKKTDDTYKSSDGYTHDHQAWRHAPGL